MFKIKKYLFKIETQAYENTQTIDYNARPISLYIALSF